MSCVEISPSQSLDKQDGKSSDGLDALNAIQYEFRLWNLIIRPPRVEYDESDLGPSEFVAGGVRATRRDLKLRTQRGVLLSCSFFAPCQDKKVEIQRFPVVVYLHGNSSSRLEACNLVGALISQRMALFCFDAAGCGQSEGEYISLGWHERDDLAAVIDFLRQLPNCGQIGLWGRSMGAVTALMHSGRDSELGALCLDSSFASLRQLVEELAQSNDLPLPVPVPSWLVGAMLAVIRLRVKALADFDIEDLVPVQHARRSSAPAIFLHGRRDSFIQPRHSQQLYDAYSGAKEFITVEGDHNSVRGRQVVGHVINFFKRCLRPEVHAPMVPTLLSDPQFAVPSLDGVPFRVPVRMEHTSTDLAKKDAKKTLYTSAKVCRQTEIFPRCSSGARNQLTFKHTVVREARLRGAAGGA